ncbi:MAG: FAD-dependent oxidoreductase [Desulfobacteraceae bacterium]|nr:FAD-dependent oxidoreductase [Desulfobacteraceae bacterium]
MAKKLVIAGGGHAHMTTLENLHRFVERGHQVTVIGPSDHHYYSGMGPGMLGNTYAPEEVRFATRQVVEKQGCIFIRDKITGIDGEGQNVRLESGDTIPYDVLSCNLGSQVPRRIIAGELEDIYLVKPIERLLAAQRRIVELGRQKSIRVGIVGGGPSAVEIAGNVWRLIQDSKLRPAQIKILTKSTIMPNHREGIRKRAVDSLKKRGIVIHENCETDRISTGKISESNGKTHDLDIIFVAIGITPNPVFADSGLQVGMDGGMLVNRYLQSTAHDNIFGGGDCICFQDKPLDKVGVYAVRQNPILLHNLLARLEGKELQPFEPGGRYLLIFNLGDGTGILNKWSIQIGGRLAFMAKDYIDRRFMKRFQRIE